MQNEQGFDFVEDQASRPLSAPNGESSKLNSSLKAHLTSLDDDDKIDWILQEGYAALANPRMRGYTWLKFDDTPFKTFLREHTQEVMEKLEVVATLDGSTLPDGAAIDKKAAMTVLAGGAGAIYQPIEPTDPEAAPFAAAIVVDAGVLSRPEAAGRMLTGLSALTRSDDYKGIERAEAADLDGGEMCALIALHEYRHTFNVLETYGDHPEMAVFAREIDSDVHALSTFKEIFGETKGQAMTEFLQDHRAISTGCAAASFAIRMLANERGMHDLAQEPGPFEAQVGHSTALGLALLADHPSPTADDIKTVAARTVVAVADMTSAFGEAAEGPLTREYAQALDVVRQAQAGRVDRDLATAETAFVGFVYRAARLVADEAFSNDVGPDARRLASLVADGFARQFPALTRRLDEKTQQASIAVDEVRREAKAATLVDRVFSQVANANDKTTAPRTASRQNEL